MRERSCSMQLIGLATLTSIVFGAMLGSSRWGVIGLVLGALIGGGSTLALVWLIGVAIIALLSAGSRQASSREVDQTAEIAYSVSPIIIIIVDIIGIIVKLSH